MFSCALGTIGDMQGVSGVREADCGMGTVVLGFFPRPVG